MKFSGLKVIALDFDGTLVESNKIKDCAFETIFGEWPDHSKTMMRWNLSNDGIERGEKFRYFVEEVLALPGKNDLIEKLTKRFEQLTTRAIVKCPFVKGAEEFLQYIRTRVAVYLVSATPQIELENIIEERRLGKYFKKVYGAPVPKVDTLKNIMFSEKVTSDETLFIGDSPDDQRVAKNLGIKFIGRQSDRKLNRSVDPVYPHFVKIKEQIKKFNWL